MSKQCTTALTACYVAKALPCSEVSDYSTQAIYAWHVAKTICLQLYCPQKMHNSLEKLAWLQRRAFHGVVPHNRAICPTSTELCVHVLGNTLNTISV